MQALRNDFQRAAVRGQLLASCGVMNNGLVAGAVAGVVGTWAMSEAFSWR